MSDSLHERHSLHLHQAVFATLAIWSGTRYMASNRGKCIHMHIFHFHNAPLEIKSSAPLRGQHPKRSMPLPVQGYIYIYIYNNGDRQIGFGEKRKCLAKPDLSHHRKGFHLFKFVNIECMPDLTHWLGPNGNRQCRLAKF